MIDDARGERLRLMLENECGIFLRGAPMLKYKGKWRRGAVEIMPLQNEVDI